MLNTFQPTHYTNKVQKIAVVDELLLVHIGLAVLSYVFFASHLFANKSTKQKRQLRKARLVSKSDMKRVKQLLAYKK